MEKENLWKILEGKLTMPQMMQGIGICEKDTNEMMANIAKADRHDASTYFCTGLWIARMAYDNLVKIGEIDQSQVFNLATHSFDGPHRMGDIGFCAEKTYRYTSNGWKFCY